MYIDGILSVVAVLPVDDNDGSKGEVSEQRLTVVHIRQPTSMLVKGDQVFQCSMYIDLSHS